MTKKEIFKGRIVELFNSVLPNNAIDDYSLDVVQTTSHTTLFSLLSYLEESSRPPLCTRETDDAVHIIYPNITIICPYEFKYIKLFFNSDVKIYLKHPEYVELEQLADFLMQVDSEMVHWSRMWKYIHDLEIAKGRFGRQLDDRSRKLVSYIVYPFDSIKIERQRLQYYNIQASRLFLEHDMLDYAYQRSEEKIMERCEMHRIRPCIDMWRQEFDDILKRKELEFLIAEEKRKALRRRNTKIQHLLHLGQTRLQVAIGAIDFHELLSVKVRPADIDLDSDSNDLQTIRYSINVRLDDTASAHIKLPYVRLNDMTGRVVESLNEINSLMPELSEQLQQLRGKYEIRGSYMHSPTSTYPFSLMPVRTGEFRYSYDIFDEFEDDTEVPQMETLKAVNSIFARLAAEMEKAG